MAVLAAWTPPFLLWRCNMPLWPRREKSAAAGIIHEPPSCASVLADIVILEAALAAELRARADEPHNDSLATLRRRHELVRASLPLMSHTDDGSSLLGLFMDFREFALKSLASTGDDACLN